MSHLISNTLPLEGRTLIQFTHKKFVKPNLKKIIRTHTQPEDCDSHQQIINQLCSKLSGRQSTRLDKQNQQLFSNYKKKLKNKRKNTLPNNALVIEDIFTRDEDRTEEERRRRRNNNHINVLKYLEKMPQKIYLHQRYNNTINQKINILHEIKEIQKKKQTYRKWANQNNNSPIKSPNFTKMTFLLDKLISDKNVMSNLEQPMSNRSNDKLFKLIDTASKLSLKKSSHMRTKSCVPNVTLEPISQSKYCPKHTSKWFQDSRMTQDSTQVQK